MGLIRTKGKMHVGGKVVCLDDEGYSWIISFREQCDAHRIMWNLPSCHVFKEWLIQPRSMQLKNKFGKLFIEPRKLPKIKREWKKKKKRLPESHLHVLPIKINFVWTKSRKFTKQMRSEWCDLMNNVLQLNFACDWWTSAMKLIQVAFIRNKILCSKNYREKLMLLARIRQDHREYNFEHKVGE